MKKWFALAGAVVLLPLSSAFAQSAAPEFKNEKLSAAFKQTQKAPASVQWFDGQGMPTESALTLLRYLKNSSSHGLNPAVYKTEGISAMMEAQGAEIDRGFLGHLLTQAFISYARDMTGPRIDPAVVNSRDIYWRKPISKTKLLEKYAAAGSMDVLLKSLEPKDPLYAALQVEFQKLTQAPVTPKVTRHIMNVVANMERLRWDKDRPARYIEANIAGQTLDVVENGEVTQSMDIIVGRTPPIETQTKEFTTKITGVRFNPPWYVPKDLMLRDKIPELKKDAYVLEREEIFVYYDGKRIDPGTIDWKNVTDKQLSHITMRQPPSVEYNRLGYVRVLMEDEYGQYLHYTEKPELFEKKYRAFSSGCMRMKEPDEVIAFIMNMPQAEIDRRKEDGRTVNMKAPQTVAFFSVYRSVTLDADGKLHYHGDIYKRDEVIFTALKEKGFIPVAALKEPVRKSSPKPPVS